MNVSSAGHTHHYTHATGHRGSSNHISKTPVETNSLPAGEAADDATAPGEAAAVSKHHDGAKGVVGLLQAGHFKGVAAVRLSINFHEQLSELNRESVRTQVEEAVASLDEGVAGVLAAYPEGASEEQVQLVTQSQETFSLAIHSAVQGFKSGESSQDDALAGIKTAFDELMSALEAGFATAGPATDAGAADEQGTDNIAAPLITAAVESDEAGQATVGGVVEEATEVLSAAPAGTAEYLANTGQVFDALMEDLYTEIDAAEAMPAFTAPKGNGVAFEKFLAMYREIVDFAALVDTGPQPAAGIDQQV